MSAAHSEADIDFAISAFIDAGRELGVDQVKALVKAEAGPGLVMRDEPVPEIGPDEVLVKVAQDRHLRHRHPYLELGRMGPARPSRCR